MIIQGVSGAGDHPGFLLRFDVDVDGIVVHHSVDGAYMIGRFWATRISAVMLQKMGIVRPIFKLWLLIHSRQPRFILEPMMVVYFRVPIAASTGRLLTSAFPCLVSRPLLLPLI